MELKDRGDVSQMIFRIGIPDEMILARLTCLDLFGSRDSHHSPTPNRHLSLNGHSRLYSCRIRRPVDVLGLESGSFDGLLTQDLIL